MSNEKLSPAAIVKRAADVRILKGQFLAAVKAGGEANRKRLEHYRTAGILLAEIKAVVGHGGFGAWIKENSPESERTCRRWLALSKTANLADLETEWRRICGTEIKSDDDAPQEDTTEPVSSKSETVSESEPPPAPATPPSPPKGGGEKTTPAKPPATYATGPSPDKIPIRPTPTPPKPAPPSAPKYPERIRPAFDNVDLFKDIAAKSVRLGNLLAEAEATPTYKAVHHGQPVTVHSSTLRVIARNYEDDVPIRPCPEGCGEAEPSPDSDLCQLCKGKGFQTKDDIGDGTQP